MAKSNNNGNFVINKRKENGKMKDITYTTNSEAKMFKAIQKAIGAYQNGVIGAQTMSDIAVKVGAKCFPLTLQLYGQPTIIGNDLLAFDPNGGLKNYNNTIAGSFTWPSEEKPCSILVNNGQTICGYACHAYTTNKPESVIYRLKNGQFGIKRVKFTTELPKDIRWAVGGMGLLGNYDPKAEGFGAGETRKTNHTALGVKNGKVYGVYYKNMTGAQINAHCKDKMQFEMAIMLDGGHIAAINGAEKFAQINTSQKQGYGIQFI